MKATHVNYHFPPRHHLLLAGLQAAAAGLLDEGFACLALPLILHPSHHEAESQWPRVMQARLRQLQTEGLTAAKAELTWAEVIIMFADFTDEGGSIGPDVVRAYAYAFIQEYEAAGEGDKVQDWMREEASRLGEYDLRDLEAMRGRLRQKQREAYRKAQRAAPPLATPN